MLLKNKNNPKYTLLCIPRVYPKEHQGTPKLLQAQLLTNVNRKVTDQFWFLEAPLVRQADCELKKCLVGS